MMSQRMKLSIEDLCKARQEQATRGTKIIGARFKALTIQSNQKIRVDAEKYLEFNKILAAENPDVVFGMWPIEYHPDHRAAANFAFNAWLQSGMKFDFYFSETGEANEMSSQLFVPNRWVDVTSVWELKHQSFMANTFINTGWHNAELWCSFRGAEYGCKYAEAFRKVHTVGTVGMPADPKPGLWWQGLHPARD
jgi:LmbE family N-acetylglucosaminyl deacetylase